MAKPGSLIYNPEIQVIIATNGDNVIDVSSDIISFSLQRNANTLSEFSCTLANKNRKYNMKIQTLDRIVVFMKRTNKLQVFSGYVVYAPIVTLLPNAVEVRATCTLKRLENTFWDATIPEFQGLVPGILSHIPQQQAFSDGGTGAGIVNLLTQVVGWKKKSIHIQKIPTGFLQQVVTSYEQTKKKLDPTLQQQLAMAIDAAGITAGNYTGTNQVARTDTTPEGAGLPGPHGIATVYGGPDIPIVADNGGPSNTPLAGAIVGGKIRQDSIDSPWDADPHWYAACHWPYYYMFPEGSDGWSEKWIKAKEWLAGDNKGKDGKVEGDGLGRRIIVINANDSTKAICVRAADFMLTYDHPNEYYAGIDLDSRASNYLFGNNSGGEVLMYWAKDPKRKCGKLDTKDIQKALGSSANSSGTDSLTTTSTTGTKAQNKIAQQVVDLARSQLGAAYSNSNRENPGPNGSGSFDCSGLTQWAYAQVGIAIPGTSDTQWAFGPQVTKGNPLPGDLIFWKGDGTFQIPGHVSICSQSPDSAGENGKLIQASGSAYPLNESPFSTKNSDFYGFTRPWTGDGSNTTIGLNSNGVSAQSATNDGQGPKINTQDTFNTIFTLPQFNPTALMTFHSPRAFVTDEPVLNSITQLTKAALRNFQSAPNGDFVAWFPDYFGRYGTAPVLQVRAIEIIELTIYHNDDPLTTHVGVTGDQVELGQGVTPIDWLSTQGIVSVQENNIMRILFGMDDLTSIGWDAETFLNKFGMRPYVAEQPLLRSHLLEFGYALTTFMQKWSDQYSTQISLTFMPEIYPGMRLQFPDVQLTGANGETGPLEVYVQQVVHEGSTTTGYNTNVTVTAPSVAGNMLHYGIK